MSTLCNRTSSSSLLVGESDTKQKSFLKMAPSFDNLEEQRLERTLEDLKSGKLKMKDLNKEIDNPFDSVVIRRAFLKFQCQQLGLAESFVTDLPFQGYDYGNVIGACCDNVFGYIPLPVGIAGRVIMDGQDVCLPMATIEGALIASVSRGCKAINMSGGAITAVVSDSMTRAPCLNFPSLSRAVQAKEWIDSQIGRRVLQEAFRKSSNYCDLIDISATMVGNYIYPRFIASTGDAMGMNMITISVRYAISVMKEHGFHDLELLSLSGNLCSDKKAASVNWIQGRGKNVTAQCRLTAATLQDVLKTSPHLLARLNSMKNHVGSAIAGALGGFNAQASNIVSALFLATGQDIAQNVESSQCITTMEQ